MVRKLLFVLALALPLLVFRPARGEPLPPAAEWVPQEAVAVLEVTNPKPLLDLVTSEKTAAVVTALPVWKKQASNPQFQQFRAVVGYVEGSLGTDWRTGLHKLLDGGVTLAVTPKGGSLLIVDAEDGKMLQKFHELFVTFAKGEAEKQGKPERVKSVPYQGTTCWTFNENDYHAILGNRLVLANRSELLKAALDLRAGKGESLASLAAYRECRKANGKGVAVTAFVDFELVKKNPGIQQALTSNRNPMAALLFAGLLDVLRDSRWVGLALEVEGDTVSLGVTADGKADPKAGLAAFTCPEKPDQGALANLDVPRRVAAMSFYRDLHGFYAAKDKLFPERTSGLIFFENMMGIFFSGRDFTEEVLGELHPEVRFVVAAQQYDPEIGTPKVQIPAFAAVFRMKHPKKFGEVAEEAWQKAVGLVSFTSGQKGQPGLLIDRPTYGETKYSVAYYSAAAIEDKKQVPAQYNFRPSLAKVGEFLVLSSADGLTKDLIDAMKKGSAGPVKAIAETNSLVEIDGPPIVALLAANRENLVRNNMIEKGHSQEQAEGEIDVLLSLVKTLGRAKLTLGNRGPHARADLELKFNLQ